MIKIPKIELEISACEGFSVDIKEGGVSHHGHPQNQTPYWFMKKKLALNTKSILSLIVFRFLSDTSNAMMIALIEAIALKISIGKYLRL